jgi:hypothetical protein
MLGLIMAQPVRRPEQVGVGQPSQVLSGGRQQELVSRATWSAQSQTGASVRDTALAHTKRGHGGSSSPRGEQGHKDTDC